MSITITSEPGIYPGAAETLAKGSSRTRATLTAAQIDALRAASQRQDRSVALGDTSALMTRRTVAGLLRRGLLVEVPAQAGQPSWRRDEQGRWFSVAITQAGLAAIQACPLTIPEAVTEVTQETTGSEAGVTLAPAIGANEPSLSPEPAKASSKRELILALLSRQEGASIGEMMAVTGWLSHTTRAALTGLRHKGALIERSSGADGKAVYRIVDTAPHVPEPVTQSGEAA